jgi:hypothetical protein
MHVAAGLRACTGAVGSGCFTHMVHKADMYMIPCIRAVCYLEQRDIFIHLLL